MATNPYYNGLYQNPYQIQPTYQPYQQPMIQPQPIPQRQSDMIWIQGGEAGAKAYMVGPNQRVVLWDQDNPVVYIKTADASGMTTIRTLDYTERGQEPHESPLSMNDNQSEYVTKNDLLALEDKFQRQINRLNSQFHNQIKKEERNG